MAKHYKIGGSTAKRTLRCPAWVNEAAKYPRVDRGSFAAERGTAMHEVLELMLSTPDTFWDAMAKVEWEFDDFDQQQMLTAYKAVETLWAKYGIEEFETEPLMSVADDVGGSADIVAASPEWVLVADFKFGRGAVDPVNNPQILFYHWLACQDENVRDLTTDRKLVGAIIQPALSSEPLIYEYSAEEVFQFDIAIRHAIHQVRSEATSPFPGDHCAWCPAEAYCAARREQVSDIRLVPLDNITNLAQSLALIADLESFIKAVQDEADRIMKDMGASIPGYKLVAKKELRKFEDPAQVAIALANAGIKDIYTAPALKSPAQLDKVIKAEKAEFDLAPWLKKPSGEMEIAPESDKREAIHLTPKSISNILRNNSVN